jgi:hypothetical protein
VILFVWEYLNLPSAPVNGAKELSKVDLRTKNNISDLNLWLDIGEIWNISHDLGAMGCQSILEIFLFSKSRYPIAAYGAGEPGGIVPNPSSTSASTGIPKL